MPQKVVDAPKNISSFACGSCHTILTDTAGNLWVTGWNNRGQLGLGSTKDETKFQRLEFDQRFTIVEAGNNSSAALTSDSRIFMWGSNFWNQLGFSNKHQKIVTKPIELKLPQNEPVASIKFGLRHTAILTRNNLIYIIGSLKYFLNSEHQIINHNSIEFIVLSPAHKILHIACGQKTVLFSDDQMIRGIGDNKFGQCQEIHADGKIIQLASGWTHSAYVTENKELFLFGRNNYGQLGNGSRSECAGPQKCSIQNVEKVELGAEHGILISNNEIFTWGWNEHGNCGNGELALDDV